MHVYIMRGISGSGKSTTIKKMVQDLNLTEDQYVVASADSYFYLLGGGEYQFLKEAIPDAHKHCQEAFMKALEDQTPHIFVDNTHTRKWEFEFYLEKARQQGCQIVYVEITPRDENDLLVAASRNQHNVPLFAIRRMWERWEPVELLEGEKHCQLAMEAPPLDQEQIQRMNHPLARASDNPLFFTRKRNRFHLEFEDLHLRAYLRITTRNVVDSKGKFMWKFSQGKRHSHLAPCLDLASVIVYDPFKGQGNFKKFLALCLDFCEEFNLNLYVENVLNERLQHFFQREDSFVEQDGLGSHTYWRVFNEGEPNVKEAV
jgi:predicted kinase